MQRQEGPHVSCIMGAAPIDRYLRVKLNVADPNLIEVAGDEEFEGTHSNGLDIPAGDPSSFYDRRAPGTHTYVASGAVAVGADVSTVAGGKVQTGTGGAVTVGVALTASGADGDLIEVRHNFS